MRVVGDRVHRRPSDTLTADEDPNGLIAFRSCDIGLIVVRSRGRGAGVARRHQVFGLRLSPQGR